MAAISNEIPSLDRKGLRNFGFTTGSIVAILFGAFFPWLLEHSIPLWPWILCAVLVGWALAAPTTLRPVYELWMRFGLLLSRITTPIILGTVFFVLITPFALVRSLFGRDSMARKLDPNKDTYRVISRKPSKEQLKRPF